jgi:hypothetical protein
LILKQKTLNPGPGLDTSGAGCAGLTSIGFFALMWEFQSFFITLLNLSYENLDFYNAKKRQNPHRDLRLELQALERAILSRKYSELEDAALLFSET